MLSLKFGLLSFHSHILCMLYRPAKDGGSYIRCCKYQICNINKATQFINKRLITGSRLDYCLSVSLISKGYRECRMLLHKLFE